MKIYIDFSVDIQENDNEIRRDNELKRKKNIFYDNYKSSIKFTFLIF